MPVLKGHGQHGDLYVEVRVETPVRLNKKQKDMLRAFAEAEIRGQQPARDQKASSPR